MQKTVIMECALDFSMLDFAAFDNDVKIQLPSEVWTTAWALDNQAPSLDNLLASLPVEMKSSVSSQQISSEDGDSEHGSSRHSSQQENEMNSFNSVPSSCESIGHSFNSVPSCMSTEFQGVLQTNKEKKPKQKRVQQNVPANIADKDLDYKKYKTRLCRNWQQTGSRGLFKPTEQGSVPEVPIRRGLRLCPRCQGGAW